MRGPLSIKKHVHRLEWEQCVRATEHTALVHESEKLHREAVSGFDPAAAKLKVERTLYQLWESPVGAEFLCCWVWLSNGRRMRAAWTLDQTVNGSTLHPKRVEWPLKTGNTKPGSQARTRQPRRSGKPVQ